LSAGLIKVVTVRIAGIGVRKREVVLERANMDVTVDNTVRGTITLGAEAQVSWSVEHVATVEVSPSVFLRSH
jgi:hypothetical protein